jgi:phage tail-like protein
MALAQRTDPLRNFKFKVMIEPTGNLAQLAPNLPRLGFAEMSGLSVTNELIAYREGGMNTHPHKMVGQSDFPPVSFSRGVFAMDNGQEQGDGGMWAWQQFIHAWNQGIPGGSTGLNVNAGDNDYRCTITALVYDHPYTRVGTSYLNQDLAQDSGQVKPGNVRLAFKLFNCWPGVFAMNGLNAGDNGILIQQMTIHHEGFQIGVTPSQIEALTGVSPLLA